MAKPARKKRRKIHSLREGEAFVWRGDDEEKEAFTLFLFGGVWLIIQTRETDSKRVALRVKSRRKKKKKKKKTKKTTRKREVRRSKERRRFGDDVSLFVRADDDDDDDDDDTNTTPPTPTTDFLSISWRKTTKEYVLLFCPRRVEIEREQKKRNEHPRGADDDDESCRGRRHRHRRRRVLRKGSVASGNASPHRFLGDVVWSVQVNQQSGGESGAGVQRELEDCENRNRSEPNFSGKVRGVWVADVDGV